MEKENNEIVEVKEQIVEQPQSSLPSFKYDNEKPIDENASDLYFQMITNHQTFKGIFSLIASCDTGIIYHCTAGKDRTGVLTCLLLLLAGVNQEDIIQDYLYSEELIYSSIGKVKEKYPSFPNDLGHVKREYIVKFLELFIDRYQTIENYLFTIGLNEQQIKQIKEKMIGE